MKRYTYTPVSLPREMLQDAQLRLIHPTILSILYKRGYNTVAKLKDALFGDPNAIIHRREMLGVASAVVLLKKAIENRERIIIYRDYDCDGIAAGAVSMECLLGLGAVVDHYANIRGIDGYGMCPAGVDSILSKWPDTKVILTVDNGIVAHEGIRHAKAAGLTVIVTDHHEPGETLPAADAIVDPKQDGETYPYKHLCGAGVIFKLMLALYAELGKHIAPVMATLDIVALATVADVVPLTGENRDIVKAGLQLINEGKRPFFAAMLDKLGEANLNAHFGVAFLLAPMVNSVSRLDGDTQFVVDMMISHDGALLKDQVEELYAMNVKRKEITNREMALVDEVFPSQASASDSAIIIREDSLTEGVIGILAGRLKQAYNRPCIVFTMNDKGLLKGSARGCDGFELKKALDMLPDGLLTAYGGHSKAAGITLKPDKYEDFKRAFIALTDSAFAGSSFVECQELDAVLEESGCTKEFVEELQRLEPFGEGFPVPVFGLKARPTSVFYMGENQKHVKYVTENHLAVIQWNQGDAARKRESYPNKFVGTLSLNVWKNTVSVQFICDG